ncbi:MAG: adenylosuccinate lyase [Gemmatimonadetes bacterium]|nr:adenylosuccinate lyase [Gemmatimonadota bacterium]
MSDQITNVLAGRYASQPIRDIWSETGRIVLEREFWIAVMKGQQKLGIDIPEEAIRAYEAVKDQVDLTSIAQRESVSRHDVKARIEEFCELAGHEHIHKGMTSRDLTDNVEQFQVLRSLQYLQVKFAALLIQLSRRVSQWRDVVIVGKTHYAAAQPTTLGKRLAMFGEEMLHAFKRLEHLVSTYPVRGLKGAVGTSLDQVTLLGSTERMLELQEEVRSHLGFGHELGAVGQIYPRGLDFEVISCFYQLGGGVANLARTLRLMAGTESATEGFAKGQVGSSAMPHKMNTRSTERINGFQIILGGHLHMVSGLVGDQWFEGDVSCSVVRRVALPDSMFAFDGMIETMLHVLDDMGIYEAVIQNELERYMPFLATTTLLMESVQRGAGREQVHEAIKEHAVASALSMREQGKVENDLAERLGDDDRLPLSVEEIDAILRKSEDFVGLAREQADGFVASVDALAQKYPGASRVEKSRLL